MYCQHAKKGWALVLVLVLLVSMSGLTFAAKPTEAASLTIANEDFATILSEGETYTFEVTARYKGSASLNWDLSENLSMVGGPVSKGVNVSATLAFSGQSAGVYSESVSISDGTVSDTLYATFTVEGSGPVNEPPVVEDLTLTTDEDTPVTGTLNASDPEGDPLTVTISVTLANGSATADGLDVTYTPDANFNGQDAFEVTVTDSGGASDTGTVSITVNPVYDPPVAVDDQATTDEMTSITIDVLANDTNVDGGDLLIEAVTNATGGSAVNNGSDVTFTPTSSGTGGFDYQLNGGSTAHVTVTIEPVTTAPTRYVALGDSIPYGVYSSSFWNYLFGGTDTDSYVEQLSRYMSVASGDFIDASVSGHNTVDVLYQIDSLSGPIAGADVITLCNKREHP